MTTKTQTPIRQEQAPSVKRAETKERTTRSLNSAQFQYLVSFANTERALRVSRGMRGWCP